MNEQDKNNTRLSLFITFLKIGAFTFGGGYAMIPLIQRELTEKRKWITNEDILDIIAIAESTPGPISVNAATFVGYKLFGICGAFIATLGLVLPAFITILIISSVLREFQDMQIVQYAFYGIRVGVLALILKALFSMYKQCTKSILSYIIILASFIAVAFFDLNVLLVIVCCALIGLVFSAVTSKSTLISRRDK